MDSHLYDIDGDVIMVRPWAKFFFHVEKTKKVSWGKNEIRYFDKNEPILY